jgi:hypothetical protein
VQTQTPVIKPNDLVTTLDGIFGRIPAVLKLINQNGLPIPTKAAAAFQDASTAYDAARPQCLAQSGQCAALLPVVDDLITMRDALRTFLGQANRTDLLSQIDAMLNGN